MQAGDLTAFGLGHLGEAGEEQFDGGQQELVAVDSGGVVGVELLLDGGGRGGRSGDGDAELDRQALIGGNVIEEDRSGVAGELLELLGGGRVGVDVSLAHPHDAGGSGDVEAGAAAGADDELRRAATDVDDDGRLLGGVAAGHGAEEGQLGLFVAAEDFGVEAVVGADPVCELAAVARVADG